jgi:hypothetical protein
MISCMSPVMNCVVFPCSSGYQTVVCTNPGLLEENVSSHTELQFINFKFQCKNRHITHFSWLFNDAVSVETIYHLMIG